MSCTIQQVGTVLLVKRKKVRTRRSPVLLEGMAVQYPQEPQPTLADVNFEVSDGEFVCVVGPSGAGKTTLLRVLTGALKPSAGVARVAGIDLRQLPTWRLPTLRRRIGMTFQDARLLKDRTGRENVTYALQLAGASTADARARAEEVLEQVGIAHLAGRLPRYMSGGEMQRVGIARALAGRPRVLFVDEPTGNLDTKNAARIMEILAKLSRQGTAVVMVTHDLPHVEQHRPRLVQVKNGTLVEAKAQHR